MNELTPIYRVEFFLDAIVNGGENPYEPMSPVEKYLARIAGADLQIPVPISSMDFYLARLCGEVVELPTPVSRIDHYLAAICGEDVEVPDPVYRIEFWLNAWASGGSGTITTVTGVSPLALVNALAKPIRSLTQYGKCVSSGGEIICNNGVLKYSPQMADVNADTGLIGYYISTSGVLTYDPNNWLYREFIPVEPGTTYTLSFSEVMYFVTISEYSTAEDSGFIRRNAGATGGNTSLTITTRSDAHFIRFGTNFDRTRVTLDRVLSVNWMLNEGGTALPYQPYVDGGFYTDGTPEVLTVSADGAETQTVTDIPMLLSAGDTKDEMDIVSGIVTRRTEAVYENGAVVVKALAEPITEQGAAHSLHSYAGTTVVSAATNVDPVTLEVEYVASAA